MSDAVDSDDLADPSPRRGGRLPREARRAQLLAAALEVFVAQGYHAAAMDDIADVAGVSKPVLYQHFPGKLDLYLALLDDSCDALIDAVEAALRSTDDNRERVSATMHAFYAYVSDPQGAFRLVFESDLTNSLEVRDRVDRVTERCATAVSALISADSGLSQTESMLLAVSLVGMAQVGARYWLDSVDAPGLADADEAGSTNDEDAETQPRLSRDTAADLVASLAWRGIRAFPRTES